MKNREIKKCFFTNLNYSEEFLNDFCEVCLVSKIGVETLGMKILWKVLYMNIFVLPNKLKISKYLKLHMYILVFC